MQLSADPQVNELNRLLDLGIKPFPWGDTPYVPTTLQPVPEPQPAPKGSSFKFAIPEKQSNGQGC